MGPERDDDVMSGRRMLRRAWIPAAVLLVAGVLAGTFCVKRPATPPGRGEVRTLTCTEAEPGEQAARRATDAAFAAALVANNLRPIALEPRWIGGMMGFETDAEVDEALGRAVAPWEQFTYLLDGAPRQAIAGETYRVSRTARAAPELVQDEHGGIWRVKRLPRPTIIERVRVEACSWGCWGTPPPGALMPPNFKRDVYLLPAGSHYRGEVEVPYDAPAIEYEIVDLGCPMPA